MKRIVLFASGSGSNVENIVNYFRNKNRNDLAFEVFTNNSSAGVIERANRLAIPLTVFSKEEFIDPSFLLKIKDADLIVLAGFLWLIPEYLVKKFTHKIINIHPALLPKYGGKGMYGDRVHKAVITNRDKQSGISIHYVNEKYDEGLILLQATCMVKPEDDYQSLAAKIHDLEYTYFPIVIEQELK